MNQREYWKDMYASGRRWEVNHFARRCWPRIRDGHYATLLDLGCGLGTDTLYFVRKGLEVTAVDVSASAIAGLRRRIAESGLSNIAALECDITDLDFPAASFDVIYAHLGLHYFDDAATTRVFDQLYEILKPGGMLCVKCKSTDDRLYGLGEKVGEDMYLEGHLRHFFSREYMASKLSKFQIVRLRRTASAFHGSPSRFIEAVALKNEPE